jgi:hypothetical protein
MCDNAEQQMCAVERDDVAAVRKRGIDAGESLGGA